jgi:hypothetical protein
MPLAWASPASLFQFLKQEALPRLIEPTAAERGFSLDEYADRYGYPASEWRNDLGGQAVLLEKYH